MSQFHEGLAEILELPVAKIHPDLSLADHNWDSLAIISCVALIDECFRVLVGGTTLAKCATVADLDALVSHTVAA